MIPRVKFNSLGSAGWQPAVVGSLPTTQVFALCFCVKKSVSGRLPDTAGWQPALPNPRE
jgi:hypothetical protein